MWLRVNVLWLLVCAASVGTSSRALAGPLEDRLREAATPVYEAGLSGEEKRLRLERFEAACLQLLAEYGEPREQGIIYSSIVNVYAQSGQLRPEKVMEYAKKALQCPVEPVQKLRLYSYWGDAIQVAHAGVRGDDLAVARRKAVMPYLQGLKETLAYNLPDVAPDLPAVEKGVRAPGEHEKQVAARELALFQGDMITLRDAMTNQISFMYSRAPFATDELRQLGTNVLGDQVAVDRLMSRVESRIQERPTKMESPGAQGD